MTLQMDHVGGNRMAVITGVRDIGVIIVSIVVVAIVVVITELLWLVCVPL